MPITYDADKLTNDERTALKEKYTKVAQQMLMDAGITSYEADTVSLGSEQVWVRVWLLVDTKEKPNGEKEKVASNPAPA